MSIEGLAFEASRDLRRASSAPSLQAAGACQFRTRHGDAEAISPKKRSG